MKTLTTLLLVGALAAIVAGCSGSRHTAPRPTTTRPHPAPQPPRRTHRRVRKVRVVALPPRLPARLPHRTLRVPILMYHRVDRLTASLPAITRGLTVEPAAFAAQMAWLHATGRHAITQTQLYDALVHGRPLPSKPVLITFDDGYRDVLQYAAPVLSRLGMPATVYVITDRTAKDAPFLGWAGLKALERRGFDIGSHTVDHLDLTTLDDHDALYQLRGAKWALERGLGHPVPWLAYPAGAENARVRAIARKAGYLLAVTTQPGDDQHADDPLELRRERVLDTTTLPELAALAG